MIGKCRHCGGGHVDIIDHEQNCLSNPDVRPADRAVSLRAVLQIINGQQDLMYPSAQDVLTERIKALPAVASEMPEIVGNKMPVTTKEVHDTLIDAERYRWMRANWASIGESYPRWEAGLEPWQLDEAVDKERNRG
jgi:hypothetical protein